MSPPGNLVIDWTINFQTMVELGILLVSATSFVLTMRGSLRLVKQEVIGMKEELRGLKDVVTIQVNHTTRLDRVEADIRELRHGEGFVFPMSTSRGP